MRRYRMTIVEILVAILITGVAYYLSVLLLPHPIPTIIALVILILFFAGKLALPV